MNEIVPKNEPVPTNVLTKHAVSAVAQIAGGILILVMHAFSARLLPLGLIFGFIIAGIGISGMSSKDKDDRKPGLVLTIAGALKLLSHVGPVFVKAIAGSLLTASCLGLLVMGAVNGIKFLKGIKSRK